MEVMKKIFSYRKHNPFELIKDKKEKKELIDKYLGKFYYLFNYLFITTVCILAALVLYIFLFKIVIPSGIITTALKQVYSWEAMVVNFSYFSAVCPAAILFVYLSDKCISLRMYAEESYEKLMKNKKGAVKKLK